MGTNNQTTMNMEIVLGRNESYDTATQNVYSFHKTHDIVKGIECKFSNMGHGFPFEFEGRMWTESELLYLCGEFSENTPEQNEIQQRLFESNNGYMAKRYIKSPNKALVRADFTKYRLQWMLFVVWQKCKGCAAFRELLLSVPADAILVEDTTTDNQGTAEVWGAKNFELRMMRNAAKSKLEEQAAQMFSRKKDIDKFVNIEMNKIEHGVFVGQNNMGKILMLCRQALAEGGEPNIDYGLLCQFDMYIMGEKIDFSKYALNHYVSLPQQQRALEPTEDSKRSNISAWREQLIEDGNKHEFVLFWGHKISSNDFRGILSQWYPAYFHIDGQIYNCAEQYMMATKARVMGDEETARRILTCRDQAEMKRLGRQVKNFSQEKWDKVKMDVVIRGNIHKFAQNKALREFLLSTGDKILVEASPYDEVWGIKMRASNPDATDPSKWNGENLLGFALMEVRKLLRPLSQIL